MSSERRCKEVIDNPTGVKIISIEAEGSQAEIHGHDRSSGTSYTKWNEVKRYHVNDAMGRSWHSECIMQSMSID